jgi:hypothetical protein
MHSSRLSGAMTRWRTGVALLLAAAALAGCNGGFAGFGGSKRAQPVVTVDPNVFPSNYRRQIVTMLMTMLTSREDYLSAMIAQPVLKPVADSPNLHYVVCLQFNARTEHRDKVVIFLGGDPQQYIDAIPQQCDGALYQPFTELVAAMPRK